MDQETDWKKYLKIYLRAVRATVMYFSFAVTSTASGWAYRGMADVMATVDYIGSVASSLVVITVQFLLIYSLIKGFVSADYSRRASTDILNIKKSSLKEKVIFIVSDRPFLTDAAVVFFWMLVLPLKFGFSEAVALLGSSAHKAWMLPVLFLLFVLIEIFAHLSVIKRYRRKRSGERSFFLAAEIAGTAAAYVMGSGALAYVISMIGVFYRLTKGILVYILLAVIAVLLVLFILKYVRAYLKRRSFIARLVRVCDDNGWILSPMENMYSSILFDREGYNFEISHGGSKYSCKMLCGIYRRSRMFLYDEGGGRRVHVLRYKRFEVPYFTSYFTYDFESENTKVLIINPIPRLVFWDHGGKTSPIDVGYMIGEYKVYNATGLLGAIERDCLDRRGDE